MIPGPPPALEAPLRDVAPLVAVTVQEPQALRRADLEGGLSVAFQESEVDAATGRFVFRGRVEARYEQTVVQCDELTVDGQAKRGDARGGVRVIDPEGRVSAESLEFDWAAKTGLARTVVLSAPNVWIQADELEVRPEVWTLRRGQGSLSQTGRTPVRFEADEARVVPGVGGTLIRVYLRVFGARLGPVPRIPFSLDRRVRGLRPPEFAERKGVGFGVSWSSGFRVGSGGVVNLAADSFPRRLPGLAAEYAYSPLDPDSPTPITPRGDLGERFVDGWFDNVSVRSPRDEEASLDERRAGLLVGTSWNQSTVARPEDRLEVSKLIDLAVEQGGRRMGFGWRGGLRLQSLRDGSQAPFVERALAEATVLPSSVALAPDLRLRLRGDLFATIGERGAYGWIRAQAGVLARPIPGLELGAAYQIGTGWGRPDFPFDPLVSNDAVHLRADYVRGPFTVRYLTKFDLGRRGRYDYEYEVALVAGAFEPFVVFREFPSDTRFGVRFRIDSFTERLQSRRQTR